MIDSSGTKIGKIDQIYLDTQTNQPEWATVSTGMFGSKVSFVPLQGSSTEGDRLQVRYTKDQVKDAPKIDPDGELSYDEEAELYRHYGLDYASGSSGSQTSTGQTTESRGTVGRDTSGPETDEAMTRSEEELAVGTRASEVGRARLRKYVVTENVTTTVPVKKEKVRVEREPIDESNIGKATDGPAISEEEHEVVLHEEEPVVETRAVPKERVRLDKETVTEQREVGGEVRKEQIEVEGADDKKR